MVRVRGARAAASLSAAVAGVLSARGKGQLGIVGVASLLCPEGLREDPAWLRVRPDVWKLHIMAVAPDHAADKAVALAFQGEAGPLLRVVGMCSRAMTQASVAQQ